MGNIRKVASLLGCPDDVRHLTFQHLSKADLRNVCLAHSRLRAIAEIYLYSEIHFIWQNDKPHHPITALLRSILRRPQLSNYIRKISFVGTSFYHAYYQGMTPRILVSEPELEDIQAFVKNTTVPYREAWLQELREGIMEAYVAVLLCQPSQLIYLFLGPDYTKESRIIGLVLRSTLCETRHYGLGLDFKQLKSVSFERYTNYETYDVVRNTADVLPLFYIPSVTHISAAIENPITFTQPATLSWPAEHAPSCLNTRSLKIKYIREPYLAQLLLAADRIQSLDWEWLYDPILKDKVHVPIIDLDQFTAAISPLRNTLEELAVSTICSYGNDIELPHLTIQGSFKAISDFNILRKFTAPLALLMGFSSDETKQIQEFLPRSLEFLTITDDLYLHDLYEWEDRDFLSVLYSWLENWQRSTPSLRGIAIFLRYMDNIWNQPVRNELQELCARVGIQLEITKLKGDMYS